MSSSYHYFLKVILGKKLIHVPASGTSANYSTRTTVILINPLSESTPIPSSYRSILFHPYWNAHH